MQTKVEKDVAERIASALELMVEKLTSIETKIEELTYEVQAHGNVLADALSAYPEEEMEGGCGAGECGSGCGSSELIQISK